jgi:hypothetical protein
MPTPTRLTRIREAIHRIFNDPRGAGALEFIEAALLELNDKRREAALIDAGQRLAANPKPREQFARVVAAFFSVPPTPDVVPDEPPNSESMRRERFAKPIPDGSTPAPAAAPSAPGDAARENTAAKIGPLPRPTDGRRSLAEVESALLALGWATLGAFELRGPMVTLADRILDFAKKSRDESTGSRLRALARHAYSYAKAAGTKPPPDDATRPEVLMSRRQIDRAVQSGAGVYEVNAVQRFCLEWDELNERGLVRMSRERYVDVALARWRQQNEEEPGR